MPAGRQVRGVCRWEAVWSKTILVPGLRSNSSKRNERVPPRFQFQPATLDNQLVRHQLDVPAHDVAPEQHEATPLSELIRVGSRLCDSSFMTPLACVTLSNCPLSVSAS